MFRLFYRKVDGEHQLGAFRRRDRSNGDDVVSARGEHRPDIVVDLAVGAGQWQEITAGISCRDAQRLAAR